MSPCNFQNHNLRLAVIKAQEEKLKAIKAHIDSAIELQKLESGVKRNTTVRFNDEFEYTAEDNRTETDKKMNVETTGKATGDSVVNQIVDHGKSNGTLNMDVNTTGTTPDEKLSCELDSKNEIILNPDAEGVTPDSFPRKRMLNDDHGDYSLPIKIQKVYRFYVENVLFQSL